MQNVKFNATAMRFPPIIDNTVYTKRQFTRE
jgi:hypothetical protein